MQKKLDIAATPELRTGVGMHGSLNHKEGGRSTFVGVLCALIRLL